MTLDLRECPLKIRQLMKMLRKAGFEDRGGKGSHRNFIHPNGYRVTLSGGLGEDAYWYQVKEVKQKIWESME